VELAEETGLAIETCRTARVVRTEAHSVAVGRAAAGLELVNRVALPVMEDLAAEAVAAAGEVAAVADGGDRW
jgi:hypothetical protein